MNLLVVTRQGWGNCIFIILFTISEFPFFKQLKMDQGLSTVQKKVMIVIDILQTYNVCGRDEFDYMSKLEFKMLMKNKLIHFVRVCLLPKCGWYTLQQRAISNSLNSRTTTLSI